MSDRADSTLPQLLAAASPGDQIVLEAGVYQLSDPLRIDKPISLIGRGMEFTRLRGDGVGVLEIVADGPVRLQDLTVECAAARAADAVRVLGAEIDLARCRFRHEVGSGRAPAETASGAGLRLLGASRGTVADCEFADNPGAGVHVGDQARPLLEGNQCLRNRFGVAYAQRAGGEARANVCEQNARAGVQVGDDAAPILLRNRCRANGAAGLAYTGRAGGEARENECIENKRGCSLLGEAAPALSANVCRRNEVGLYFADLSAGEARGNECRDNRGSGVRVTRHAAPRLEDNRCEGNGEHGVLWEGAAGGEARGNVCRRNGGDGLRAEGKARPRLLGNRCEDNAGENLRLLSPRATVEPSGQTPAPSPAPLAVEPAEPLTPAKTEADPPSPEAPSIPAPVIEAALVAVDPPPHERRAAVRSWRRPAMAAAVLAALLTVFAAAYYGSVAHDPAPPTARDAPIDLAAVSDQIDAAPETAPAEETSAPTETPAPAAAPTPMPTPAPKSFTVSAAGADPYPFKSTGIHVYSGQRLAFTSRSGSWTICKNCDAVWSWSGPEGGRQTVPNAVCQGANLAELVAVVRGYAGKRCYRAGRAGAIVFDQDGDLSFGMNDSAESYPNHEGAVTVSFTIE